MESPRSQLGTPEARLHEVLDFVDTAGGFAAFAKPHDALHVRPGVPEAPEIGVVRASVLARTMCDSARFHPESVRYHQRRQVPVHVVEIRKLQVSVATEGP